MKKRGEEEVEVSLFFPDRQSAQTFVQGMVFYHAVKEDGEAQLAVLAQVIDILFRARFVQLRPAPTIKPNHN